MFYAVEVNLCPYKKLSGNCIIPKCYGPDSFLVTKDNKYYIAQNFYQSMIKDSPDDGISPFHCEIMAMGRLDNGSKSICKYFGFNDHGFEKRATVLLEYIDGKSLHEVIAKRPANWNETNKFKTILGISLGMKYAHQRGVCHRDLRTENILLDSNFNPKICNFESAKVLDLENPDDELTTTVRGKIVFMDPIIYSSDEEGYNPKAADVYSFAFLVYSILSGHELNLGLSLSGSIVDKRPSLSNIDNDEFSKLIEDCWSTNENNRPTFDQITDCLINKEIWLHGVDENVINDYISSYNTQNDDNTNNDKPNPEVQDSKSETVESEIDAHIDKKEKTKKKSDKKLIKKADEDVNTNEMPPPPAQPEPKVQQKQTKKKSKKRFVPKVKPA